MHDGGAGPPSARKQQNETRSPGRMPNAGGPGDRSAKTSRARPGSSAFARRRDKSTPATTAIHKSLVALRSRWWCAVRRSARPWTRSRWHRWNRGRTRCPSWSRCRCRWRSWCRCASWRWCWRRRRSGRGCPSRSRCRGRRRSRCWCSRGRCGWGRCWRGGRRASSSTVTLSTSSRTT